MQGQRSLSEFWREDKSDDRVAELTSVLRGSDSLIGVMGSGVRAVWSTNGESETWWVRTKQGKPSQMRVFLDYSPLRDLEAPFSGQAVDEVIGYASHEGGHCLWSTEDARNELITVLSQRPGAKAKKAAADGGTVEEILRIANIVEDAYIDFHVAEEWPVLGEYIHHSRRKIAERRPIDYTAIAQRPQPSYRWMKNLWIACSLYDYPLPDKMSARVRRAITFLVDKSVEAVKTKNTARRTEIAVECWEHLTTNFPPNENPLPRKTEAPRDKTQSPATPPQPAEKDKAQMPTVPGPEIESIPLWENEGVDGCATEQGEQGGDDGAQGQGASSGASGDSSDSGDSGDDGDGAEPSDGPEKGQEHGHFGGDEDEGKDETGEDDTGQQGGDSAGTPGDIGDLDEFDVRDISGIPDEILAEIVDAIAHEMEDISRSVADVISQPPQNVDAQTRRADYDGPAAERVREQVEKEIQELRRVFDRQASVKSRYLSGLTVGKLDTRRLARVGAGSFNVYKRRELLQTPNLAVGLLLDVSGSMDRQLPVVWATASVFAEALIQKKGVNFLALTYTGGMFEVQTTRICDRSTGKLCLANVEQGGGTPSGPAIASMKVLMDRMPERDKVIIHFTDGAPDEAYSVMSAVEACRKAGYKVWAISLDQYARMLAQQYGEEDYETIGSVRELPSKVANLVKKLVATR